jgi:hypothetical protein
MKKLGLLMIITVIASSCGIENVLDCYNGEFTTTELSVASFEKLDIEIPCEITLLNGETQKVIIEGREDMISDLEKRSKVVNGEWQLRLRNNCIVRGSEVKITLIAPGLKKLDIDGNAKVFSEGKLSNLFKNFEVDVDGNAEINLDMMVETFDVKIDGNAKLNLKGSTDQFDIDIDGNSTINGHDLLAKNGKLRIDGNGTANVNCQETLEVTINGSGKVCYKGNPSIVSKIDGVGKVNNCN